MNLIAAFRRIGHMVKKEFIQTLRAPQMRWLLLALRSFKCWCLGMRPHWM